MKNEFQKHKKSDSVKWGIAFTLIAILLITAVLGILQAFTDFKPSEWFTGNNEETSSSEETPECEHVFDHGVCTKCGSTVKEVIPLATRVVSPDEDCTVNFWTQDYQLIESKSVKGGDVFEGIEGYNDYIFMFDNTLSVQSYEDVKVGDVLINGKFYSLSEYSDCTPFAAAFPSYYYSEGESAAIEGVFISGNEVCFCKYNDRYVGVNGDASNDYYKPIDEMDVNDLFYHLGASESVLKLIEGDTFEFLSYMPNQFLYVYDDIMCIPFELVYSIPEQSPIYVYSLDVVNVVVIDYETPVNE